MKGYSQSYVDMLELALMQVFNSVLHVKVLSPKHFLMHEAQYTGIIDRVQEVLIAVRLDYQHYNELGARSESRREVNRLLKLIIQF